MCSCVSEYGCSCWLPRLSMPGRSQGTKECRRCMSLATCIAELVSEQEEGKVRVQAERSLGTGCGGGRAKVIQL